jgi:hypothetical protein
MRKQLHDDNVQFCDALSRTLLVHVHAVGTPASPELGAAAAAVPAADEVTATALLLVHVRM